jgi:hypothetical protein
MSCDGLSLLQDRASAMLLLAILQVPEIHTDRCTNVQRPHIQTAHYLRAHCMPPAVMSSNKSSGPPEAPCVQRTMPYAHAAFSKCCCACVQHATNTSQHNNGGCTGVQWVWQLLMQLEQDTRRAGSPHKVQQDCNARSCRNITHTQHSTHKSQRWPHTAPNRQFDRPLKIRPA